MINYFQDIPQPSTKHKIEYVMRLIGCNIVEFPYIMGQVQVESMNFTKMRENLNYKDANRITKVFPRLGRNVSKYVGNPKALGNALYGDYDYRGYGGIQLTWKENHDAFFKSLGRPLKDYATELSSTKAIDDFYLTIGFYFKQMRPKLKFKSTVKENVLMYSQLINCGVNCNPDKAKPQGLKERMDATSAWIAIVRSVYND